LLSLRLAGKKTHEWLKYGLLGSICFYCQGQSAESLNALFVNIASIQGLNKKKTVVAACRDKKIQICALQKAAGEYAP